MDNDRSIVVAWVGLLLVTLIWSGGWLTMKVATGYSGPFAFSVMRYFVGTVVLFALIGLRGESFRPTPWLPTVAVGLTQTAAFQALAQWALMSGGAGKVTLLAYTMPFWVVLLAWVWLGERLGRLQWLCVAVAAAGFTLIVEPWRPMGQPLSIVLAVLSGFSWAAATVISKRFFVHHADVSPMRFTAWQMLVGTVALAVLDGVAHEQPVVWSGPYIGAVLYNGVLSSGIGWFLWAVVIRRLPASVAGLTSLAVPALVVLLAWFFFSEQPSGLEWKGIVLIAVALLALNFVARRNHRMTR